MAVEIFEKQRREKKKKHSYLVGYINAVILGDQRYKKIYKTRFMYCGRKMLI